MNYFLYVYETAPFSVAVCLALSFSFFAQCRSNCSSNSCENHLNHTINYFFWEGLPKTFFIHALQSILSPLVILFLSTLTLIPAATVVFKMILKQRQRLCCNPLSRWHKSFGSVTDLLGALLEDRAIHYKVSNIRASR